MTTIRPTGPLGTVTASPHNGPVTPQTPLLITTALAQRLLEYLSTRPCGEVYGLVREIEVLAPAPVLTPAPIPPWHPADLQAWVAARA